MGKHTNEWMKLLKYIQVYGNTLNMNTINIYNRLGLDGGWLGWWMAWMEDGWWMDGGWMVGGWWMNGWIGRPITQASYFCISHGIFSCM